METPTFIIVTADDENVIETTIVQDEQNYKAIFTAVCESYGQVPTKYTFEDGVLHLENGTSIWIAQVAIQL